MDSDRSSRAVPPSGDFFTLLRTLKRLAQPVASGRFGEPRSLWQFQVDLLELQRKIQSAISSAKNTGRRTPDEQASLEALRRLLWHARQLGDAYAWAVLGCDRAVIHALGDNQRVRVSPTEDHGDRGVMGVASMAANDGWGFPLLHDVTDCLRIGDITFISYRDDLERPLVRTVEVKTRLLDEETTENGEVISNYSAVLVSPEPFGPYSEVDTAVVPNADASGADAAFFGPPAALRASRMDRQMQRMAKAFARQRVEADKVTDVQGQRFVRADTQSASTSHWRALRRVIRRSRERGYAFECADETFFYAAFYDSGALTDASIQGADIAKDVWDSCIILPGGRRRNHLLVHAIPPIQRDTAHPCMPYYLYPIPRRAKEDLLCGRLALAVIANTGRIVGELESAGFTVSEYSGTHPWSNGTLLVSSPVADADGNEYVLEIHQLWFHVLEAMYEFKSVDYIVEVAEAIKRSSRVVIPWSEQERNGRS